MTNRDMLLARIAKNLGIINVCMSFNGKCIDCPARSICNGLPMDKDKFERWLDAKTLGYKW